MGDFSKAEQIVTRYIIQNDAESIFSLLKSEKNPIFCMCVIPYYVLFVQSCEEYIKSNAFDDSTEKKIKCIRNNIKVYAERFGKTTRRIVAVDNKQDLLFQEQLRFGFMKSWNIHYNIGTFWTHDKKIIGNTQMLSDVLGINDILFPGVGENQKKFAHKISSYIVNIRRSFAARVSPPDIFLKGHTIEIPFYCDFNTNKRNGMIKKKLPKEIILFFLHLLCNLNFVRYVLYDMFFPGNAWIFRIQYITTYYAFYALNRLNNYILSNPNSGIDIFSIGSLLDEGKELFSSDFRNCMMHYDLQGRGVLIAENMNKPLFGLVENCFSGQSFESYSVHLENYRNILCEYLEQYFDFSKIKLKENK